MITTDENVTAFVHIIGLAIAKSAQLELESNAYQALGYETIAKDLMRQVQLIEKHVAILKAEFHT
jgi:hypothetical protein